MAKSEMKLAGVKVLLAVSGGVAAYKAVDLASKLTGAGASVQTAMTAAACELVRPKSFEAVTGGRVYTNLWTEAEEYKIGHVSLGQWADIVVLAPATADVIGKIANGICDDLVSTIMCACWAKKVIVAPAMNVNMWENPAVQKNVETMKAMGFEIIGPREGRLACGTEAMGRMAEPAEIMELIERIASATKKK